MNKLFIILTLLSLQWTLTYSQNNQADTLYIKDSLLGQLKNGNEDLTIVTEIYRYDKNLTEDSLNTLFNITNDNYFKNTKSNNKELDLKFRQICFSDQLFRTRCYYHKTIDYSVVRKNDSLLQVQFIDIQKNHPELNLFDGSFYQPTFDILLIHSVATPKTRFFEDNFSKYTSYFGNDFKEIQIQLLMDLYLKFKFNKQYFNTDYGKGVLPDKSFGFLQKISDNELKYMFSELKISGAKY